MASIALTPNADGSLTVTVQLAAVDLPATPAVLNQLSALGSELSNALGAIQTNANNIGTASTALTAAAEAHTAAVQTAAAALAPAEPAATVA